jgi:hypothetical protein
MNNLEKGVIPLVKGGLGNQMFTMAAAYVVHKTSGMPLYVLQNPSNKHNLKMHDYNKTIFKHFGLHLDISQEGVWSLRYRTFCPGGFSAWYPESINPGTCMDDYFQFYTALEPYEVELRELFLSGLSMPSKDYSSYAFLHIRRGDYLTYSDIHYIQPLEYYMKASENFSKILVVSDDMKWVREQDFFKSDKFELFDCDDELETLAIMASCKAGAIIANSTFSWWGAFLGAYGSRSRVYAPKHWISLPVVSLFPEEWIIV